MTRDNETPVATAASLGEHSSNASQTYYDPDGDGTLTQTVLDALEDASDEPADESSFCLYDVIDPDALNALFEPTRTGSRRDTGRVSFSVEEFRVSIHATGHVFVRRMG